jgi:hypothetical protein
VATACNDSNLFLPYDVNLNYSMTRMYLNPGERSKASEKCTDYSEMKQTSLFVEMNTNEKN